MNEDCSYVSYDSLLDGEFLSTSSDWQYRGEILLDPERRQFELEINSKPPAAFHVPPGGNKSVEFLQNLQPHSLAEERQRNLSEKYPLKSNGGGSSANSSLGSPCHRISISGSRESGSLRKLSLEEKHQSHSLLFNSIMSELHSREELKRKSSIKEKLMFSTSTSSQKPLRSNSIPKDGMSYKLSKGNMQHSDDKHDSKPAPSSGASNSSTRTGRVRQVKQRKNGEAINRKASRSASARKLFFSLRKYRERSSSRNRKGSKPPCNDVDQSPSTTSFELSSDVNLPGILKIFGDVVSPGANYKSVMATKSSTAEELVKIALERYGVSKDKAKEHVLCEVVGRLEEKEIKTEIRNAKGLKIKGKKSRYLKAIEKNFKESYARPLNDLEKPLVLQSYWKPQQGMSRRFEIRRRLTVFNASEKDSSTSEVNAQAKRLVLHKSRINAIQRVSIEEPNHCESDDDKVTSFNLSSAEECRSYSPMSMAASDRRNFDVMKIKNHQQDKVRRGNSLFERVMPDGGTADTANDDEKAERKLTKSGPPYPYLITLQGNENNLIHSLDKPEVLIGSDVTDFKLEAPDVIRHHCVIKRKLEMDFSNLENQNEIKRWCVTINPLYSSGEVRINGGRITNKHNLQHGELISIGKHHLFMFKDPSSHVNLSSLVNLSFNNKDPDNCSTEAHDSTTSLNAVGYPDEKDPRSAGLVETVLNYKIEDEDEILRTAFNSQADFDNLPHCLALYPATVICHCIIHACLNFNLQHKNDLLLKIASTLQTLVLNATSNVLLDEDQFRQKSLELGTDFFSSLNPVVFWMSNSLEVYMFLHSNLIPIIKSKVKEEKARGDLEENFLVCAEQFEVNEEILALLEEVVMYAFQQLVYYLTKTLFSTLPAILECNPFVDNDDQLIKVDHINDVYSRARQMMVAYNVNESIREQLFAYLFFFTNVSLFNTLMEEGSMKYYKWELGVRIRGNLELIESWAADNDCMNQCTKHLEKISTLANLLATPRGQFAKGPWSFFRDNFPALSTRQLHRVLAGYSIPGHQLKMDTWMPAIEEFGKFFEAVQRDFLLLHAGLAGDLDEWSLEYCTLLEGAIDPIKHLILESYDSHPPLVLPVSECRIDLCHPTEDPYQQTLWNRIEDAGAWLGKCANSNLNNGRREQPDGKELTKSDIQTSQNQDSVNIPSAINKNNAESDDSDNMKQNENERVGLSSSDRKAKDEAAHLHGNIIAEPHQKSEDAPSQACNSLNEEDDVMMILPIVETTSLLSRLSLNKGSPTPISSSSNDGQMARGDAHGMPKEVFIVDIKKGPAGLGVGLVDGMSTALSQSGVYVRSLIPDDQTRKHSSIKHHDVIYCWLQEGRLQLGDRILAANGVSIIEMSYYESIQIIKQAGENVRLLVGRCGSDVALKITSIS